jgi:hypothetical protein
VVEWRWGEGSTPRFAAGEDRERGGPRGLDAGAPPTGPPTRRPRVRPRGGTGGHSNRPGLTSDQATEGAAVRPHLVSCGFQEPVCRVCWVPPPRVTGWQWCTPPDFLAKSLAKNSLPFEWTLTGPPHGSLRSPPRAVSSSLGKREGPLQCL